MKKGQISFEYLILMGFVTLVISGILGIAFYYTNSIQDQVRITQINKFANKLISTSEYILFSGEPSKATIVTYLPDNVKDIEIFENSIVITLQTSSGLNVIGFVSKVNITEFPLDSLTSGKGLRNIQVEAVGGEILISQV